MNYVSYIRNFVKTNPIILNGTVIIAKNETGQILLQKRADSLDWGLIGGFLEMGESLEETAVRELFEETGMKAERLILKTTLSGKDLHYVYPNGDEVYTVVSVFEAEDLQGKPIINDNESLELRYFSINEPIENLNPLARTILQKTGYITDFQGDD